MNSSNTSRRSFLGSLAVLSAGAAFGSVGQFLPLPQTEDLQQLWKNFSTKNSGRRFSGTVQQDGNLPVANGHFHRDGDAVVFSEHHLVAKPTWIYWNEEARRPSDVVVTFFSADGENEKLFRLNRFELEALQALPMEEETTDSILLLKRSLQKTSASKPPLLKVKAKVRKGQQVNIIASVLEKETVLNKKIIYHV
ncbi:twin-arginine translocation signal domain-containing protein [Flavisolibacter nicotianae]|uniref:twin-arginine translocation signal domain-containing protein n=1 Tax=Flavisolibacter nicotianae TaxID=2364882 RepID=UPI000EB44E14|nr:twin-arginine translocation signal domain-containing protein [Flavisolibacter nicotianae]